MIRATLERVTQITVVFILNGIVDLLILYVSPDLGFIEPNGTDILTAGPEAMAFKVLFQTAVFLEHDHGTLTLQIPHDG